MDGVILRCVTRSRETPLICPASPLIDGPTPAADLLALLRGALQGSELVTEQATTQTRAPFRADPSLDIP
jgi:hypothetical protein